MQRILICLLCFGIITGCHHVVLTTEQKKQVHDCQLACYPKGQHCLRECQDDCRHCGKEAKKQAVQGYRQYYKDRVIQGVEAPLDLQSFRDPLQCRKISCDCLSDYQICLQACTKVIHKSLREVKPCC